MNARLRKQHRVAAVALAVACAAILAAALAARPAERPPIEAQPAPHEVRP